MGAGASLDRSTPNRPALMSLVNFTNANSQPAPLIAAKTQWRLATRTSVDVKSNEQDLLDIVSDPVGQKHLGAYAKKILTSETFFCWVEINDFKDAPSLGYRKSLAKLIHKKYIKSGSPMALGSLPSDVVAYYENHIKAMETNEAILTPDLFDLLMKYVLSDMYQSTFVRFKASAEYSLYRNEVKETYNRVTVDDFEYLELLGSGGFGRVVHARKKSTGKHYAMKVQLKAGLLDEYQDQLAQITSEKDILQACHNPFVLDMHYSFQTPAHAIIVTELVRGGDLGSALVSSRESYLSEDRVRLYAAEIGLALNHMHELGLIYRDLKPVNVLLGEDGHIVLADMGLAAGFDSCLLRVNGDGTRVTPASPKLTRRKTTVGTKGYMAPEIIAGKLVKRSLRPGYTYAIDYWSLGVTIYELLTGYQPFGVNSTQFIMQQIAQEDMFRMSPRTQHQIELQKMTQGTNYPSHLSRVVQEFLQQLLEVNPDQRLGCNPDHGFAEFMRHPFFDSIDWEKLMVKHIDPTYRPALLPLTDRKIYNSYQQMMAQFDARDKDYIRHDWYKIPPADMQKHFDSWDYISSHTLRAELGIANELDASNIPYKVLQLTGEDAKRQIKSNGHNSGRPL